MPKRVLLGQALRDTINKTVSVMVTRKIMHPLYGKTVVKTKKYLAHDPEGLVKKDTTVKIEETRPISKRKKWRVIYEN